MSDARDRLSEALANAKVRKVDSPPSRPAPAKPSPKPAPARSAPATATQSKPKPAKKAPRKKPKKKGPGAGSALFKNFQSFANNVLDELKSATSELSPGALISQANDGLKSIRKAVVKNAPGSAPKEDHPGDANTESGAPSDSPRAISKLPDAEQIAPAETGEMKETAASVDPSGPEAQTPAAPPTSPAKVKRAPTKKAKPEPETEDAPHADGEAFASESPDLAREAAGEEAGGGEAGGMDAGPEEAPLQDAAPATSPAKVKRTATKKKPDEESAAAPPEAERSSADTRSEPEAPPASPVAEAEAPSAPQPEQPPQEKKRPAPKPQPTMVSKSEHAVRSFRALQIILNNPIWSETVLNPKSKPSALFAPRTRFDAQFQDPVFREGLKAASRLATAFAFAPDKILFNEEMIARVKGLELDPNGKIKPHTENITSVIDKKTIEQVIEMLKDGNVKHLLYSVGTRLGMFVPTIESLARIYLGLRKKEPLSSGDRLKIQEEILMRYKKAPYTEEMGKKARNLALNYFMDYLSEYGLKLYKDRFDDVPDGQNNPASQYKRHMTIISFCHGMIEDRCKQIALSTSAIETVKTKFTESANEYIRKTVGEPPPDL